MGTRGSIGVIYKKEYKGTYNHFDSYPSGLGIEVVDFCNMVTKENGWDTFKENFSKIEFINDKKPPTPEQIEMYKEYADLNVSNQSYEDWYCLLRNVQGAESFQEIYKGKLFHLSDGSNFIKNSLFCEYAYIINLDDMKIEFYQGFQKESQKGNRFGETPDDEYYPCKLVTSCSLEYIPTSWASIYFYEGINSNDDDEFGDKMCYDKIEPKKELIGAAKKYVLTLKQLDRKKEEIQREIEKYELEIKKIKTGLDTTEALISTLPNDIKKQYDNIETAKEMSNEEFEATLYKTVRENKLL